MSTFAARLGPYRDVCKIFVLYSYRIGHETVTYARERAKTALCQNEALRYERKINRHLPMDPPKASDTAVSEIAGLMTDVALQPFLADKFDPIDFLNATLPPLTLSSTMPHAVKQADAFPLAEVSAKTQGIVSQLNAQTTRLSDDLTQLTDEILRSGARLAYEVEVLRGESTGLTEALGDWLQQDIRRLIPDRKALYPDGSKLEKADDGQVSMDPPFITQLRMLTLVRSRLERVISTFGEAMEWILPPSEVSLASSFISVSAPDAGPDAQHREAKGKEFAKKLRDEISNALASDNNGSPGTLAATKRIEELRDLAIVWKGTAEEKARLKFVDGLSKMVEDYSKAADRDELERRRRGGSARIASPRPPTVDRSKSGTSSGEYDRNGKSGDGTPGFFRNLQRLRDEIYLE